MSARTAEGLTTASGRSRRSADGVGRFTRWPLLAAVAGVAGFAATILTDSRPPNERASDDYTVVPADVLATSQSTFFLSMVIGYCTVVLLLVLGGAWRRHVESGAHASTAAHVVSLGLTATAGALALAFGWRGALANYMPGGVDEGAYDLEGLWVLYMINDFGAYIAWVPMLAVSGAIAWLAFRERVISRWIGAVNGLYVLLIGGAVVGTGVPGLPGTLAAIVLAITGLGLAFGRSPLALSTGRS